MKNIINSYELDFAKDIPLEMSVMKSKYNGLDTENKTLKTSLVFFLLVFGLLTILDYQKQNGKREEK
jgi:hypothetical protein